MAPSRGSQGSNLELLSDPKGVDFRPYLIRILAAVRRNWLSVVPEAVKLGRRGRVGIQFSIARDGSVPKLVIAAHSGADALDRAAVAGISMSNPFPPLPAEFKGDRIVVQFNFAYNMPKQ
jgi:TonB family protein